jgi:hypothetical protein
MGLGLGLFPPCAFRAVVRGRALDEQALAMRQRLYDGDHTDPAGSLGNPATDLAT